MIQCEGCGRYFHADEIERCPKCDDEFCTECFEKHVLNCASGIMEDVDFEYHSTIPHFCPNCDEKLELDVDADGSARVYCEHCDYELELNEDQIAELNSFDDEEE